MSDDTDTKTEATEPELAAPEGAVAVMHPDNPGKAPKDLPEYRHEKGPLEGHYEGTVTHDGDVRW